MRKVLGVGVIVLAVLGIGAVSNSPYYALPSWSQKIACAAGTCPRFIELADWNREAVLDRETGLVWERNPLHRQPNVIGSDPGVRDWNGALEYCALKEVGGRYGWRLPTLQELATLIEPESAPNFMLPPGHPFANVGGTPYWTATEIVDIPAWVWLVDFAPGPTAFEGLPQAGLRGVWCVRGGTGRDAQ